MKVLALLFVLASCTPKEAPVATEPQAVETTTTEEAHDHDHNHAE